VEPPDDEGMMRAVAALGEVTRVVHPVEGLFDLSGNDSVTDAVIEVITRHPMRQEELVRALQHWTSGQVGQALRDLDADGRAQVIARYGHRFWTVKKGTYAEAKRTSARC
jgi:hypothetical protein